MDMRPALPVDAVEDTGGIRVDTRDGTRYQELELVYTEYDIGRFRAGYCCIECGEAQPRPFPLSCSVCGFPMKTEQTKRFGEEFGGVTTIGPSRSLAELRAEDDEAKEKARRDKGPRQTNMIWLPS